MITDVSFFGEGSASYHKLLQRLASSQSMEDENTYDFILYVHICISARVSM